MATLIRACTIDDLIILQEFSRKTYDETFRFGNTAENMEAYLDSSFDVNKVKRELLNPNSHFYFLYSDGVLAGYLKTNETSAQTEINDDKAIEIERIYVDKAFHGKGLGRILMDKAIEFAKALGKTYVWLGVWEKNDKALLFYKKSGFYQIGQHSFFMGEDEQTDLILRRDLV